MIGSVTGRPQTKVYALYGAKPWYKIPGIRSAEARVLPSSGAHDQGADSASNLFAPSVRTEREHAKRSGKSGNARRAHSIRG